MILVSTGGFTSAAARTGSTILGNMVPGTGADRLLRWLGGLPIDDTDSGR